MFYYVLKYVLLGPLLRLVFRPRIEGLEHVPATGPAIVAAPPGPPRTSVGVTRQPGKPVLLELTLLHLPK